MACKWQKYNNFDGSKQKIQNEMNSYSLIENNPCFIQFDSCYFDNKKNYLITEYLEESMNTLAGL